MSADGPVLEIRELRAGYGKKDVLHDIGLEVRAHECFSVIGANTAGKSTLLRCISGLILPRAGRISFMGDLVSGLDSWKLAGLGIGHVPEGRHVFPALTVEENLRTGLLALTREARKNWHERIGKMYAMFPVLGDRRKQLAGSLSGGEQQMLAIARVLISEPRFLLLDEPSHGLAPLIVDQIHELIVGLRDAGLTILLVEQNASLALSISNRAMVLERGVAVLVGDAKEVKDDPRVREAYLGI